MTDLKPPANAGVEGGFTYATQQAVTVDIALPYPVGTVSIYEKRILSSLYDNAGNVNTAAPEQPVLLASGQSSATISPDGQVAAQVLGSLQPVYLS